MKYQITFSKPTEEASLKYQKLEKREKRVQKKKLKSWKKTKREFKTKVLFKSNLQEQVKAKKKFVIWSGKLSAFFSNTSWCVVNHFVYMPNVKEIWLENKNFRARKTLNRKGLKGWFKSSANKLFIFSLISLWGICKNVG